MPVGLTICEDIWQPGVADEPGGARRGDGRGQHLRVAVRRGQGHRARADDRPARARPPLRRRVLRRWSAGRTSSSSTATPSSSTTTATSSRARRSSGGPARRGDRPPGRALRAPARHAPQAGRPRAARGGPAASARSACATERRTRRAPRSGEVTPLLDRCGEIYEALVLGTRDYVEKNGFRHVVIGLSGGIDSTLVALLAVDALGPDRVTTVTMPSPYSSSGTLGDAHALARNLGVQILEIPIKPMMERLRRGAARAVRRPRARHHRGEPAGAHPRQPPHGAVQQVRLARAHDRQQVRARRRLLDAVRRQRGRLRGHQGRPQDAGLRARRAARGARRRGARAARDRHPPAVRRAAPRPARRGLPAARTRSSTASSRATSSTTSAASSSSRAGCRRRTSTASSGSSTWPSTSGGRTRRASRSPRRPSGATGACRSPTATAVDRERAADDRCAPAFYRPSAMSALAQLPSDQQAVLDLVLRRGRSYVGIASALHLEIDAVRERARKGVSALGASAWAVPGRRRAQVTDWLLGQADPETAEDVCAYLRRSRAGLAWARSAARELGPLAGDKLPALPDVEQRSLPPTAALAGVAAPAVLILAVALVVGSRPEPPPTERVEPLPPSAWLAPRVATAPTPTAPRRSCAAEACSRWRSWPGACAGAPPPPPTRSGSRAAAAATPATSRPCAPTAGPDRRPGSAQGRSDELPRGAGHAPAHHAPAHPPGPGRAARLPEIAVTPRSSRSASERGGHAAASARRGSSAR